MKKLLSLCMTLALGLALCVPAYAAPVTIKAPSGDMTITLSDAALVGTGTVYGETCKIYEASIGSTISSKGDEENVTHWYFSAEQISDNEYTYDDSWYQPVPSEGLKLEESILKEKLNVSEFKMMAVVIGDDVEETFLIKLTDKTTPATPTTPTTPAASSAFTDVAANSPYKDAIAWAVEQGITNGTSANTFSPGNTCTIRQILTFLYRANGKPGASNGVSDMDAAENWAVSREILSDTVNTGDPCTRAMAVTCMWKAAGSPAPSKTASFADVPASADYAKAVSWAVEQGITNGTGGDTFSPGGTCTRGQIVTFLYRASK